MRYTSNRAQLEASLAAAHRAVNRAKLAADSMNDDSLWLDLQQIEVELKRLGEDSIMAKRRQEPRRAPDGS